MMAWWLPLRVSPCGERLPLQHPGWPVTAEAVGCRLVAPHAWQECFFAGAFGPYWQQPPKQQAHVVSDLLNQHGQPELRPPCGEHGGAGGAGGGGGPHRSRSSPEMVPWPSSVMLSCPHLWPIARVRSRVGAG